MKQIRLILKATGIASAAFLLVGSVIALASLILELWTKFSDRFDSYSEGMLIFMAPFVLFTFVVGVVFVYLVMDKKPKP